MGSPSRRLASGPVNALKIKFAFYISFSTLGKSDPKSANYKSAICAHTSAIQTTCSDTKGMR